MKAAEQLIHPFPPTWDRHSEILILGSFPSVKSREMAYFYGHPQNRFWRLVAALYEDNFPKTVDERRAFLLRHHIALWDVIASCTIVGSSDSSIRDAFWSGCLSHRRRDLRRTSWRGVGKVISVR